ncbi:hypothetical protein HanRHA438_Chr06g0264501 [Helianthus annuus]|nr:hypothetical protein HanRHA438_Chr06g0264501 [Helianthus annuus]
MQIIHQSPKQHGSGIYKNFHPNTKMPPHCSNHDARDDNAVKVSSPYPQILHHVSIHETPRDVKAAFVAIKYKTSFHIK